ncbi:Transmembrane protein 209 [Linum perenne]
MEARSSPSVTKSAKFTVYQNPSLTAALTAASLQPSKSTFLYIVFLSSASALALFSIVSRETGFIEMVEASFFSQRTAYLFAKAVEGVVGVVFFGCLFGLLRVISWKRVGNVAHVPMITPTEIKDLPKLTSRQLGLLGVRPKVETIPVEYSKKPPKSKPTPASDILIPIHQPTNVSTLRSRVTSDKLSVGSGNKMTSFSSPSKSQTSPSSLYLAPRISSPLPTGQSSPGMDSAVSTPWSNKRASSAKEITTEEELEKFLADVDARITESAGKHTTPPPTVRGFGILSPSNVATPTNTSGTARSTPLRPVRMSPGSQKFTTPPKKGEGDLPPPMSMEESIEAFTHLGIYPQIEQWRDSLRQWFSSVLLSPLINKIETSHVQVMQTAADLGIAITVSQVGNSVTGDTPATLSSIDGKEWQAAFTIDEDGRLHQLRASLVHAIDASASNFNQFNKQQSPQQNPMAPILQKCLDAVTEHQKLGALMRGEWGKGLLPYSNVREDLMVQRIRELAEGTCVKNYEYIGTGEACEPKNKKRNLDLPTDSHLLLYLFCAFLEHPKWMLHVDPTSYAGAQSSKNPLFLGVVPPKERFPEKYIAVVSAVPSTLHPGACILVMGKQSPPVFALYWDKMQQLSLQGRTALWDSIIVMCHRIKVGYGSVVRGMHLGSSALDILAIVESQNEG